MNTQNQNMPIICPNCQHRNEEGAEICAKCGNRLVTTLPVEPKPADTTMPTLPHDKTSLGSSSTGVITLLIPGYSDPIVLEQTADISLGRAMPNEMPPTVDFTRFEGGLLGVSRRHALIRSREDGCFVQDLNSTNGTWLNENKLAPFQFYPLRGGDQLRLGNLIVFVYFSNILSIHLTDAGAVRLKLTPDYLGGIVVPYLNALSQLQEIINVLSGRKPAAVIINQVGVVADNVVNVKLDGATEAVGLIREYVVPWKKRQELVNLHQTKDAPGPQNTIPLATFSQKDLLELAGVLLSKLNLTIEQDQAEIAAEKMTPCLKALASSSLEITRAFLAR
jgi:hypothetical protein